MKNSILIFALLITNLAFGQDEFTAEKMAKYQNDLMIKELNLGETQQEKVSEINLRFSRLQKKLIDKEGSMFGKIGKMRKINKNKSAELERILNKKQFEKYEDDLEPKIRKYMRANIKM